MVVIVKVHICALQSLTCSQAHFQKIEEVSAITADSLVIDGIRNRVLRAETHLSGIKIFGKPQVDVHGIHVFENPWSRRCQSKIGTPPGSDCAFGIHLAIASAKK